MGALELAASKRKIPLPPNMAVDAEIKLNLTDGAFFLSARLDVSPSWIERSQRNWSRLPTRSALTPRLRTGTSPWRPLSSDPQPRLVGSIFPIAEPRTAGPAG
jgi:hypothetical protein